MRLSRTTAVMYGKVLILRGGKSNRGSLRQGPVHESRADLQRCSSKSGESLLTSQVSLVPHR